ncbi:MAG: glycoside hydrolase family 55 protein [Bacteroidales bacterium]|nr:glycoside hydrolase family 55 protein [Bacteroidales bacterium]
MRHLVSFIFLFLIYPGVCFSQYPVQSSLVYPDADGKLVYQPYTDKGDILPDFSWCGYMGGGVDLPEFPVVATVKWNNREDDTPYIQAVIDSVAKLKTNHNGLRGAILIKKGIYRIASPLRVTTSGIVLRGEGNDKYEGTILLATGRYKYNVIEIGTNARMQLVAGSERQITDDYVPSGTRILHVKGASKAFKSGDKVLVNRPSNAAWIRAIDMDSIPPRPLAGESTHDSFRRLREGKGKANMNGTVQWKPGSKDLRFERTIVSITGDAITLNIPLTNALQKEYGGGTITRYEYPGRISQCGVEYLYGMSVYDENIKQENRHIGLYCCDEKHANTFIAVRAAENTWVKKVNVDHFDCCVSTSPSAIFFTGQDLSATNPVSVITGGRRYAYSVSGQMNLFERCYAGYHRHEFVLGSTVAGPNAFVDGLGDMNFASSEPHHRWAAGCLYDNITIKGPEGSLLAVNRGWYGSGHGWAGAQIVFWNCSAPVIMVMQPPTAQNFAIGNNGSINDQDAGNARRKTINAINGVSRSNFEDKGVPAVGDGWIEHPDKKVGIKSLYYAQLKDRKGTVKN